MCKARRLLLPSRSPPPFSPRTLDHGGPGAKHKDAGGAEKPQAQRGRRRAIHESAHAAQRGLGQVGRVGLLNLSPLDSTEVLPQTVCPCLAQRGAG